MTPDIMTSESLVISLYEIGAVKFGRFRLHSGQYSPIYIDLRVLVSFPDVLRQVASAYANIINSLEFDILAAYPYAGLPLGVAVSLETDLPLVYPRKNVKSYGTGKQVEGVWQIGQKVVLIEDLITSGKSIIEACATLKASGLQVTDAVVLIDRDQGGVASLQEQGIRVLSIVTLRELLAILEKHGRLTSHQRADVLSQLNMAQV